MRQTTSNANTPAAAASAAADSIDNLSVPLEEARVGSLKLGTTLANALDGVIAKGKSATSIIDALALSLSKAALSAAFKPLEGAVSGAIGSVFSSGMTAFASGGVISSPVAFPLGGGQTGLAGEAGPEAIMPLTRGADGKLGVATNGGGGGTTHVTFNVTTPDAQSFARSETQLAALLARTVSQGQRNL
jgi:phage-related minor tail protein